MLQALGDMLSTGRKANAAVRKHQVKPVRIYFVISLTNAKNPVNITLLHTEQKTISTGK